MIADELHLGRIAPPDQRHLELHPFQDGREPPPPLGIEVDLRRPHLNAYDQGPTPKCVAFSTSKLMNFLNGYAFSAPWLYDQCKLVDGMPNQDGTNARAACDVLRTLGHLRLISGHPVKSGPDRRHGIASNSWATSVDQIRAVFAQPKPQPVLLGTDWLRNWFKPERRANGEFWLQAPDAGGPLAGGHEYGLWRCSDVRQGFGISNNWSLAWPDEAHPDSVAWISYQTVAWLLARGGDACVIHDLATR